MTVAQKRPEFRNINAFKDLPTYRLPPAGWVSILHRISGALLFVLLPLVIWMMHSFLSDLPYEILEAARIDGVTLAQEFRLVILPLAIPGLMATILLCFIFSWNELLYALVLINKTERKTAAVVATSFCWVTTTPTTSSTTSTSPTGAPAAASTDWAPTSTARMASTAASACRSAPS